MAVRLHRCSNMWVKLEGHPCWRVQRALEEAGVSYDVVRGPLRPGKRDELERISGQRKYPVLEFEDGSAYREESREMAATIKAGRLDEKRSGSAARSRSVGPEKLPAGVRAVGAAVTAGIRRARWLSRRGLPPGPGRHPFTISLPCAHQTLATARPLAPRPETSNKRFQPPGAGRWPSGMTCPPPP